MLNEKTTVQISIRVTDDVYQRLVAEAQAQSRPLANYIKAIVNEHLASLDRVKKIANQK